MKYVNKPVGDLRTFYYCSENDVVLCQSHTYHIAEPQGSIPEVQQKKQSYSQIVCHLQHIAALISLKRIDLNLHYV